MKRQQGVSRLPPLKKVGMNISTADFQPHNHSRNVQERKDEEEPYDLFSEQEQTKEKERKR